MFERYYFTCEGCGGVFLKGWSDEEAQAEYDSVKEWRGQPPAHLCEDCYQACLLWAESQGLPVPPSHN